ncbi:MAG TPA: SUMF1/EgtB/PvdO family nonheme iron enzyme [Candidatus Limnocylindrales bacterium]|nr:SUMF1/EgtB/PvdO family nonheme iron enzyme [Candidatus Limnocylindrales bacterium]
MTVPAIAPDSQHTILRSRMDGARQLTDRLFAIVQPGALYERTIPERHRLIFYLGHLEAFDWNLIARGAADLPSFDPGFDKLFAFGIDPVDGKLPSDQPSDWPVETRVRAYVSRVRGELDDFLSKSRAHPALADGSLLHVAVEHRLMHAETVAYLLHQLPFEKKVRVEERLDLQAHSPQPRMVFIPAGIATLGQLRGSGKFGWDNEFEEQRISVPEFRADACPVTNGQFLEFVRSGGYQDRSLWSDADWAWKEKQDVAHPFFWRHGPESKGDEAWSLRTIFADIPLPLAWPVYVSHAEASAYARWAGKKLPTEAQWHRMAYGTPAGAERSFPWGEEFPHEEFGNFDSTKWNPTPVHAHPKGESAFGVADLLGNGWEWTSTTFAPFPGFAAFPFYAGYSADFFDSKHFVMKGGSPRTPAALLRRSFRNWFQPHYPYIYSKFRCVSE